MRVDGKMSVIIRNGVVYMYARVVSSGMLTRIENKIKVDKLQLRQIRHIKPTGFIIPHV